MTLFTSGADRIQYTPAQRRRKNALHNSNVYTMLQQHALLLLAVPHVTAESSTHALPQQQHRVLPRTSLYTCKQDAGPGDVFADSTK